MARPSLLVGAALVPNWIFPARSLPGYSGKTGKGEKSSLGDCFNGESVASQSQESLGVLVGLDLGQEHWVWNGIVAPQCVPSLSHSAVTGANSLLLLCPVLDQGLELALALGAFGG